MVAEVQEMQDDLSRFIEGMKKNHVKVERAILEYVESRNGQAKAVLEVHDLAQYSSKPSHALEEAKTLLADYAADTHREVEAFEAHATAYYTNVDPRLIPVIENSRRNSESTVQKDVLQEAKELFRLALLVGSGYHMLRRREAESTIAGAKSELLGLLQRNLQSQLRHVQDESQSTSTLFLKVHERILREGIKGITQSERSLQETLNQQMRLLQEAIYRITEHGGMFTAIARDTNAPGKDIWSEHAKAASKKYEWTRKIIIESCEKKGSRYHEQPAVEGQVRKGGQPNPTV
ncbi:hypothetical protein PMZ80_002528 [Knufia obscura]|nr:hypothetical protein PMZ80_002528 [Knufia obscura]